MRALIIAYIALVVKPQLVNPAASTIVRDRLYPTAQALARPEGCPSSVARETDAAMVRNSRRYGCVRSTSYSDPYGRSLCGDTKRVADYQASSSTKMGHCTTLACACCATLSHS